jgi:hypothetical protein
MDVLKRSTATYHDHSYDFLACALIEEGIRAQDFGGEQCVE